MGSKSLTGWGTFERMISGFSLMPLSIYGIHGIFLISNKIKWFILYRSNKFWIDTRIKYNNIIKYDNTVSDYKAKTTLGAVSKFRDTVWNARVVKPFSFI